MKIIIMTSMPEHSFIQKAKDSLLEICDRTMNGEFVWPDNSPTIIIGLAKSDEFTDRELDVIRALATGYRYEEMAEVLYMSPNTVKYHVKSILQKTGFRSTIQLVAEVVEKRLVLPKY